MNDRGNKLRVALVGNRAHQNTYGPIWASRPDVEVVALAEHNPEKAAGLSELYGLPCSSDYDAVLERDDVDVVCLCTDFYLKRTLLPRAVECGKHVLVDKSLARTVAEAREIATRCEGTDRAVMIAYPQRYQPGFLRLQREVQSGRYGRVVSYTHQFIRQFPDSDLMSYVSYPTAPRVNGGGELMNLGSHPIDLLAATFGMPRRVYAHFETAYWKPFYDPFGTEDVATLFCEYEGLTATIVTGRNKVPAERRPVNAIDLWCDGFWVRLDEESYTENGEPVELPKPERKTTATVVDEFVTCVKTGTTPSVGISDGVAATELTTAGYQSAASGAFVKLPLKDIRHPMISDEEQVIEGFLD